MIEGVAKDKNDKEEKEEKDEKENKHEPENKRKLTKPIIGGMVYDDLNQLIQKVRRQVHEQYDVELNGFPGGRKLSRQQITNLVNKQANDKMREILGKATAFTIAEEFMHRWRGLCSLLLLYLSPITTHKF